VIQRRKRVIQRWKWMIHHWKSLFHRWSRVIQRWNQRKRRGRLSVAAISGPEKPFAHPVESFGYESRPELWG
jgi:hypothetical protein